MNDPLASLSKRARAVVTCLLILPWVIFAVVALDLLPASWRFELWPPAVRGISVAAFILYFIAEVAFEVWLVATTWGPVDE